MEEIFNKCKEIADKKFDGHMTLFKFTTNWRFCFGTPPDPLVQSYYLYEGETPQEAMKKALKDQKCYSEIKGINNEINTFKD